MKRPRLLATFAIVVALFAMTGPFGTITRLNAAERIIYWLLVHGFSWATAIGCSILAANLLRERLKGLLPRLVIGSVAGGLPIALEAMILERIFAGGTLGLATYGEDLLVAIPLCVLFSLLTYLTLGMAEPADPAATEQATMSGSFPLARRLKPENRGSLIRLSAEDHYTDVVTGAGRELILIRFSDALTELGSQAGMQVHRSHWVADAAVLQVKNAAGRMVIVSIDGFEIPVSRTNQAEVRSRFAKRIEADSKRKNPK